ncbi:DUF1642 domain-containing protein [Streptococcus gordonii]|uniref:DUF1642 domain-containing protein n=1 Tax=Streptococcus gordonii TaxID=1302 RepID=UPI001CBC2CDA|nr:DUF1642 domain-containing protein [Streptococcus gordonii]MBZ2115566.1 DUF1642 domain-containing protein [Streptococcus gordonii]
MKSTTEMDLSRIKVGEIKGVHLIELNDLAEKDNVKLRRQKMSKKELVGTLMERMQKFGYFPSFTNVKIFIREYEKMTKPEPQKPVVRQFVADWIEYCKFTHVDLQNALLVGDVYFYNYANQNDFSKLKEFLKTENNQENFARAWLDGYEVEKEKRYIVKFKGFNPSYTILKYHQYDNTWFLGGQSEYEFYRTKHTRKELEQADFGWVFDCEGVELQKVE